MNRFTLVAWTAAFTITVNAAHGQIAVNDAASIVQQATSAAKDLAAAGERLSQLKATLAQAEAAYQAVTGVRDLGGAVNALGSVGISNPLPINPSAVSGLMNGTGGVGGMSSNIGHLFNGASSANTSYNPTGETWIGREMTRAGNAGAGAQALALELYRSAGERQTAIEDLRCQIELATDPATRESLIAQLSAANAAATAQHTQATALGNYAAATQSVDRNRLDQQRQMESDAQIAQGREHGINVAGSLGSGS